MIDYDNDCLPASLACRYTWHHIMIDYDNDCLHRWPVIRVASHYDRL